MTKRFLSTLSILLVALVALAEGRAKYVFYFIGDGMGVNQVNAAETYLGALEGRIGIQELCFPSFPYFGLINTQSATNGVTDSAAGGTALASGNKTKNGALGVLKDLTTPVTCIAHWAKDAGAAVGVSTSVSIDHATPAAFYSHVPKRSMAYEIGSQLPGSGFDFFAASDFVKPNNPDGGPDLYAQATTGGYTIARGYKDYQKKAKKADKMILFQTEEASKIDNSCIPYALDRTKDDLTLQDITRAGINFLMKKQGLRDGFFFMVEGGKIDWACHANDPTFISELIDMDNAIKIAYEFYQQHPDETLIVVSADHETGGLVLGRGAYELNLKAVSYQRMSMVKLDRELKAKKEKLGDKFTWDEAKKFLTENFGFWDGVKLDEDQTKRLESSFNEFKEGKADAGRLCSTVKHVISEAAMIGWQSGGHSNGYVPAFAIGVGAEQFHGRFDNTEICKKMAKAAGWKTPFEN
ncbi:MAG: alkaline phosphatase [Bacteroidaceae bacterium]|nr:alkaline phosphatase [Bacteroidaceae bacterium]